jgi:predicted amidophosphoribosyltransferase
VTTKRKVKKEHLSCPYCDREIMQANFPYCQACQVTIFYCPGCGKPVPRDKRLCPHCGAEIKG